MGHASIEMTMMIFHPKTDAGKDAVSLLDRAPLARLAQWCRTERFSNSSSDHPSIRTVRECMPQIPRSNASLRAVELRVLAKPALPSPSR